MVTDAAAFLFVRLRQHLEAERLLSHLSLFLR